MFSLTDIEEITQKAGNFKKFSVFVRMLTSALSKESESVLVDLLTFSDLEMLKSKKSLQSNTITASHTQNRNYLKRYVILTYSNEFDRVHYPLPLSFEDVPNIKSLQAAVARLRKRLSDKQQTEMEPSTDRER